MGITSIVSNCLFDKYFLKNLFWVNNIGEELQIQELPD